MTAMATLDHTTDSQPNSGLRAKPGTIPLITPKPGRIMMQTAGWE